MILAPEVEKRLAEAGDKYRQLLLRAYTPGKASPRESIKAHCLQCTGYRLEDVRGCTARACPLYLQRAEIFRVGRPESEVMALETTQEGREV